MTRILYRHHYSVNKHTWPKYCTKINRGETREHTWPIRLAICSTLFCSTLFLYFSKKRFAIYLSVNKYALFYCLRDSDIYQNKINMPCCTVWGILISIRGDLRVHVDFWQGTDPSPPHPSCTHVIKNQNVFPTPIGDKNWRTWSLVFSGAILCSGQHVWFSPHR